MTSYITALLFAQWAKQKSIWGFWRLKKLVLWVPDSPFREVI